MEAGSGSTGEALSSRIDELSRNLTDIGEHVAALQVSKDEAETFSERLTTMLDWFEANREGIEVLLSIGDDMKVDDPVAKDPAAAALTLDQINATTKPQTPDVPVPDVLKDPAPAADAAAPQTDPAPEA